MSEHSELVKDARDQAMTIDMTIINGGLDNHLELMQAISPTLRALAAVVEEQDKRISQLANANIEWANGRKSSAELAAACVTCEEVISWILVVEESPYPFTDRDWIKLRATRKLAQVAVENWKKSHVVEPQPVTDATANDSPRLEMVDRDTLDERLAEIERKAEAHRQAYVAHPPYTTLHGGEDPVPVKPLLNDLPRSQPPADWDRYHELLDKLPELTPTEQVEYNRFLPIIERLDAEEGQAADVGLNKLVEEHERIAASIRRLTAAVNAAAEQHGSPPPPIKVEMLIVPPPWKTAGWTWVTVLADLHLYGSQGWPCEYFESHQDMAKNGNAWLVRLGEQLGVELVADWKGGE